MKRIWDLEKKCMMAIDGEYEFELAFCFRQIKQWKKSYIRANSKLPVRIGIRCFYAPPEQDFWKYYLEISRNGKLDQTRICQEAYDVLKANLPDDGQKGQVEIITLERFEPII